MGLVIDVSVVASWALEDERNDVAERVLVRLRREGAVMPALFFVEIRSTLIVNERRGRISEQDTSVFLMLLRRLPIAIDTAPSEDRLLDLARAHKLTVYDAAYLELALRENLELVTFDAKLQSAASAEAGKRRGC